MPPSHRPTPRSVRIAHFSDRQIAIDPIGSTGGWGAGGTWAGWDLSILELLYQPVTEPGLPRPAPPRIDRRDVTIPIGASPGISAVAKPTTTMAATAPPGSVLRVPALPAETVVSLKSWAEWIASGRPLPPDWNRYPTPESYPIQANEAIKSQIVAQEPVMDLGQPHLLDVLGGLAGQYVSTRYGSPPPKTIPFGFAGSGYQPTGGPVVPAGETNAFLGIDPLTGFLCPPRRRRRRKRLATMSDIKDLAALSAVLGKGKAFTTWIATHPG